MSSEPLTSTATSCCVGLFPHLQCQFRLQQPPVHLALQGPSSCASTADFGGDPWEKPPGRGADLTQAGCVCPVVVSPP